MNDMRKGLPGSSTPSSRMWTMGLSVRGLSLSASRYQIRNRNATVEFPDSGSRASFSYPGSPSHRSSGGVFAAVMVKLVEPAAPLPLASSTQMTAA